MQTYSERYDFFDRFRSVSSTAIDRGIGIGRFGPRKPFGPRKLRCVNFSRQTYSERYDFFDRFRLFSSTAIGRGIGIDRIGVEKTTFDFKKEINDAQLKSLFDRRKSRCVEFSWQTLSKPYAIFDRL